MRWDMLVYSYCMFVLLYRWAAIFGDGAAQFVSAAAGRTQRPVRTEPRGVRHCGCEDASRPAGVRLRRAGAPRAHPQDARERRAGRTLWDRSASRVVALLAHHSAHAVRAERRHHCAQQCARRLLAVAAVGAGVRAGLQPNGRCRAARAVRECGPPVASAPGGPENKSRHCRVAIRIVALRSTAKLNAKCVFVCLIAFHLHAESSFEIHLVHTRQRFEILFIFAHQIILVLCDRFYDATELSGYIFIEFFSFSLFLFKELVQANRSSHHAHKKFILLGFLFLNLC